MEQKWEYNWIGFSPLRCMECCIELDLFTAIDYCDYKCNGRRIQRLGLDRCKKVHLI